MKNENENEKDENEIEIEVVEKRQLESVTKVKKLQYVKVENIVAAVNPRSIEELEFLLLLPDIVEENGIVTKPCLGWDLPAESPLWDEFIKNGELRDIYTHQAIRPTLEERKHLIICLQGHRRTNCLRHIRENEGDFSPEVFKNAETIPMIVHKELTRQRAEDLALDDKGSRHLFKWEVVKLFLNKLRKGQTHAAIALEMPQMLFTAFRNNGESDYSHLVNKFHNESVRNDKIVSALRNYTDVWIKSCFDFGPAFDRQLQLFVRFEMDKRPKTDLSEDGKTQLLKPEFLELLLDLKLETVRKIYKPRYVELRKEAKEAKVRFDWTPITKIAKIKSDEPDSIDGQSYCPAVDANGVVIPNEWFIVVGGNFDFRKLVLEQMVDYAAKNKPDTSPKPPSTKQRENVNNNSLSDVGKSYSQYSLDGSIEPINGMSWIELDANAAFLEALQKAIIEEQENLPKVLQKVVESLDPTSSEPLDRRVDTIIEVLKTVKA